jgi:hypothetical protein
MRHWKPLKAAESSNLLFVSDRGQGVPRYPLANANGFFRAYKAHLKHERSSAFPFGAFDQSCVVSP